MNKKITKLTVILLSIFLLVFVVLFTLPFTVLSSMSLEEQLNFSWFYLLFNPLISVSALGTLLFTTIAIKILTYRFYQEKGQNKLLIILGLSTLMAVQFLVVLASGMVFGIFLPAFAIAIPFLVLIVSAILAYRKGHPKKIMPSGKIKLGEIEYAGFWIRFAARLIDFFACLALLGLIFVPATILIATAISVNLIGFGLLFILGAWLVAFFVFQGYFIILHALYGQTIGKKVVRIKVIKTDGDKIGWGAAILREIGEIIASIPLCLGYLWIDIDDKNQGWHDKIANTYVVRVKNNDK